MGQQGKDMSKPGMSKSDKDMRKGPQNQDKQQRQGGGTDQQQGGQKDARLDDPERMRDPSRQDDMTKRR
jgi:hypothetical protein